MLHLFSWAILFLYSPFKFYGFTKEIIPYEICSTSSSFTGFNKPILLYKAVYKSINGPNKNIDITDPTQNLPPNSHPIKNNIPSWKILIVPNLNLVLFLMLIIMPSNGA